MSPDFFFLKEAEYGFEVNGTQNSSSVCTVFVPWE